MRTVSSLLFIAIIISISPAVNAQSVRWWNFNKGLEAAKARKKPVIVSFYADWCQWCKTMDRTTFADRDIIKKLNNDYIAIKIETPKNERLTYMGRSYNSESFAHAMGVEGLPTVLFLDKNGAVITRLGGYIRPHTMTAILDYIREECYTNQVPFKDYISGKTNCKGSGK